MARHGVPNFHIPIYIYIHYIVSSIYNIGTYNYVVDVEYSDPGSMDNSYRK